MRFKILLFFVFLFIPLNTQAQTSIGNLNGDSVIDVVDLGIFLSNWGATSRPPSDFNQDGRVDVVDLGILLGNWGPVTASGKFLPDTIIEAEAGELTSPMFAAADSGANGTAVGTSLSNQGNVKYTFSISNPGDYILETRIKTPDSGSDSFYIGLDSEPAQGDEYYSFDSIISSSYVWDQVSRRGNGTFDNNQYDPYVFDLSAGEHTFTIYGRETGAKLDQIALMPYIPSTDTVKPQVTAFSVSPTTLNEGETITATYTVTDNEDLKQAVLWHSPDNTNWDPIKFLTISGKSYSGTFTDTPPSGTNWYGLHVFDVAGNEATEGSFGPAQVTVDGSIMACSGREIIVGQPVSASNIEVAANQASPGDCVIVPDGIYHNIGLVEINSSRDGTAGNEIILRSESPGGVVFGGSFQMSVNADYWIIKDFIWDDIDIVTTYSPSNRPNPLSIIGSNCRITNNHFRNFTASYQSSSGDPQPWGIQVYNPGIRIDHNLFTDSKMMGIYLRHTAINARIDHNYFKDFPSWNRCSAMQIGTGDASADVNLNAVVEYNILVNMEGDSETISNKSNRNTYRHNVFIDSRAMMLRQGHRCLVENNYFIGTGTGSAEGINILEEGHVIKNNYFHNLDDSMRVLWLQSGSDDITSRNTPAARIPAQNVLIINNTFAGTNCSRMVMFGSDVYGYPVKNIIFMNNIFHGQAITSMFYNYNSQSNTADLATFVWENNIAYTSTGNYFEAMADPGGISFVDPGFIARPYGEYGDFYVLPPVGSPALDAAMPDNRIATDFDGQTRSNPPDIGADEFSTAPIEHFPIGRNEVGPSWMGAH